MYRGGQFYWWKNRSIRRKQMTCRKSLTNFLRTPEFIPGSQWGSCYSIFSFMSMLCRSLFVRFLLDIVLSVILSFFFWPLCCLSIYDLLLLITPLVSSKSSYRIMLYRVHLAICEIGTIDVASSTSRHEQDSNLQSYNVVHTKAEMYIKYLVTQYGMDINYSF